jgi:hypothetical protein
MKTNVAIDSSSTKEVPFDANIDELLNGSVNFALVGLGVSSLTIPT